MVTSSRFNWSDDTAVGFSYLWPVSSSLLVSSPGSAGSLVAPLGKSPEAPVCTRCPWSPGTRAQGCRWCWPLWAGVEGSHRSPCSPRPRWSYHPPRTLPVRSGGCRHGCSDTSSCQGLVCVNCWCLREGWERRVKQGSFWTPAEEMIIRSEWHQLWWGRSCLSTSGPFAVLGLSYSIMRVEGAQPPKYFGLDSFLILIRNSLTQIYSTQLYF